LSFSARQQYYLEAMGMVPWVSRKTEPLISTVTTRFPSDLQELAVWLPEQPLADFGYKGAVHTVLGHPDAPVMVVVQRDEQHDGQHDGDLPLSGDAAQLFELMMRSIDLGRSDIRQCALASQSQSTNDHTVIEACTAHTRAMLVLVSMEDTGNDTADAHHFRLAPSQLPAWRIAHPTTLLRDNQRKRQAWQVLKALQLYLAA